MNQKAILQILNHCSSVGIRFSVSNGQLGVEGSDKSLNSWVLGAIKNHSEGIRRIVQIYGSDGVIPKHTIQDQIDELAKTNNRIAHVYPAGFENWLGEQQPNVLRSINELEASLDRFSGPTFSEFEFEAFEVALRTWELAWKEAIQRYGGMPDAHVSIVSAKERGGTNQMMFIDQETFFEFQN